MKFFKNRFDPKYREVIKNKLSLASTSSLKSSALNIKSEIDGIVYEKLITIDFIGVSCSIFFDEGGHHNEVNSETSIAFTKFLKNIPILNSEGYRVKMRFLLVYPYSDYAFTRIQAESNYDRTSVNDREFIRFFKLENSVDSDMLKGSTYYENQVDCLSKIQELLRNKTLSSENDVNTVRVRFTPVGTSLCVLKLNDEFHYDSYILAKQRKREKKLITGAPLLQINAKQNSAVFEALEDHFRYLWTLDSTLYCEDATQFNPRTMSGLDKIKIPEKLSFNSKAKRLKRQMKDKGLPLLMEDEVIRWKYHLTQIVQNRTQNFVEYKQNESIFITCSWKSNSKGKVVANEYATKIEEWIKTDFCPDGSNYCLIPQMVKADTGKKLSKDIYETLNNASLALIIMTKDLEFEGSWYSKPNIYHELGYLMKQLEGTSKLMVLAEEGVYIPSNINDWVHKKFKPKDFEKAYFDILDWFNTSNSFIPFKLIQGSKDKHKLRIN